jgi:hypothetical protein
MARKPKVKKIIEAVSPEAIQEAEERLAASAQKEFSRGADAFQQAVNEGLGVHDGPTKAAHDIQNFVYNNKVDWDAKPVSRSSLDGSGTKMSASERAINTLNNPNATSEQIAAANRILDNQEIRKNSGRGGENISSKNRGATARNAYENNRANREGLTLEERVIRNESGTGSGSLTTKEAYEARIAAMNEKQDAADKALEQARNQAQKKEADATQQLKDRYAREASQQRLDEANKTLPQRIIGEVKRTGQNLYDGTLGRRRINAERMEYNQAMHNAGTPEAMIDSTGEYLRLRNQVNSAAGGYGMAGVEDIRQAKMGGMGKVKSSYTYSGSSVSHGGQDDAADDIATKGFLDYAGGAVEWALQDTQHAMLVAGTAVGVGLIGSELLDDDSY